MANQGATALNQDGTLMLGVGEDGKMYPILVDSSGALASAAAIGTPSDAPWDGTGDGTVIAILKKIANNTNA